MKITLRAARVNAKLTQSEVGEALKVSKRTVGLWESGDISPRMTNVLKMLKLYKTPIENIIFEEEK